LLFIVHNDQASSPCRQSVKERCSIMPQSDTYLFETSFFDDLNKNQIVGGPGHFWALFSPQFKPQIPSLKPAPYCSPCFYHDFLNYPAGIVGFTHRPRPLELVRPLFHMVFPRRPSPLPFRRREGPLLLEPVPFYFFFPKRSCAAFKLRPVFAADFPRTLSQPDSANPLFPETVFVLYSLRIAGSISKRRSSKYVFETMPRPFQLDFLFNRPFLSKF